MQFIRKMLIPGLVCAIVVVLWLAAADRARSATPGVMSPDSSSPIGAVARNDSAPVVAEPGSIVSLFRTLFVS